MSEKRRVVVTGLGVASALGCDPESFWSRLTAGESGISVLEGEEFQRFATRIGGVVRDFPEERYLDRKESKNWDRYIRFGAHAALQALEQAQWKVPEEEAYRTGVFLGSGVGGLETLTRSHEGLLRSASPRTSPYLVPMMIANMGAGIISILTGAKGPTEAPVSACATGNNAIGNAFLAIREGRADVMIAGGAEAPLNPLSFGGFCSMRAMSTRNDEPEKASRPFDADRAGFVMAEGAGVLVLEEREHALDRGAQILAEITGYGQSSDAHHITSPDPEGRGGLQAMRVAVEMSGWNDQRIDYINAHGTGTPLGDGAEVQAIKNLLGTRVSETFVGSTKSAIGHLFGAAGGIEAVITVLALQKGVLPPTLNLEKPEFDLNFVGTKAVETKVERAISNGFGFGGHNAVVAFERLLAR